MKDLVVTSDLSEFGFIERQEAGRLLLALGTNKDHTRFLGSGVQVFMNKNSGYVFLTDEDYNTAMLDCDGILQDFITCPECGNEDLVTEFCAVKDCCKEYHKEMAGNNFETSEDEE
jgi:hypothetical protein